MRRREFIALAGGAVVAWPFTACAQQTAVPVIGFINGGRGSQCPLAVGA
jgi:hypothetical protein